MIACETFILAGIIVVCCAAYTIGAESFEFSVVILKVVSISIKIISSPGRRRSKRRAARS